MRAGPLSLFATGLAIALGGSRAEAQPAPAFTEAVSAWQRCLADQIRPRVQSSDSAETLAALALAQCKAAQAQAIAVGEKHHGAAGRQAVLTYIGTFRADLPRMLGLARSGQASDKPMERWAQCAASTAMVEATKSDDAPEAVADRAFASCRAFEDQAFAEYRKGSAQQLAEQNFSIVRRTMRGQVVDAVKGARTQKR